MNPARIEEVFGYALAVAAQADHPRDRELGPIHLLKYLYLADLAHAETHDGETYSGVSWRFHKFGPWAVEAFQQIEPAMAHLGAGCRQFASSYRDDSALPGRSGGVDAAPVVHYTALHENGDL